MSTAFLCQAASSRAHSNSVTSMLRISPAVTNVSIHPAHFPLYVSVLLSLKGFIATEFSIVQPGLWSCLRPSKLFPLKPSTELSGVCGRWFSSWRATEYYQTKNILSSPPGLEEPSRAGNQDWRVTKTQLAFKNILP